jgi:hypothetical protein
LVYSSGDFNRRVHEILLSGQITEKTATFAFTFPLDILSKESVADAGLPVGAVTGDLTIVELQAIPSGIRAAI